MLNRFDLNWDEIRSCLSRRAYTFLHRFLFPQVIGRALNHVIYTPLWVDRLDVVHDEAIHSLIL